MVATCIHLPNVFLFIDICKMRALFSDNYNSLFHFIFGIMSYKYVFIVPIMLLYQQSERLILCYLGSKDSNILIDLSEFFIGYLLVYIYQNIFTS